MKIAATDEATDVIQKATSAGEGLAASAAQAGAQFLIITEAVGRAYGMLQNFISGAVAYDSAISRSSIMMRLAKEETEELKESIDALSQSEAAAIFPQRAVAEAFRLIADEGRGVAGTLSILEAAMNLATVAGSDLGQTTLDVEDILSAFNLKTEDAARVTDILFNTMMETGAASDVVSGDLIRMGQVFDGLNMSIEESAALIGTLRDRGISNIQGLLTGFQQMAAGEGRATEMMDRFSVSVFDATGTLKPMTQVFGELRAAGATAQDMFVAFGQRSATSMTAVIQSLDDVRATAVSNFDATGVAAEGAATHLDSDAAAAEGFQASLETLKDELAKGLLPAITNIMEALQPLFKLLTDYPEIIYLLVGAFVAYKIALIAYTIAQWLANTAAWAFPAFWIIGAIILLVAALYLLRKHWDKVRIALVVLLPGLFLLIFLLQYLVENWDAVTAAVGRFGEVITQGLMVWFELIKEKVGEVIEWLLASFNIGQKMYEMGKEILQRFIDGIHDAFDGAKGGLEDVARKVAGFFGGSLPEYGQLKHIQEYGQDLMGAYVAGMGKADITAQVGLVAQGLLQQAPGEPAGAGAAPEGGGTTTNNYYIVDGDDFVDAISGRLKDKILTARGRH